MICIEFDYFKKGNLELFVPRISSEDTPAKPKGPRKITALQEKYYRIFDTLLREFRKDKGGVIDRHSTYDSWCGLPSGYGNSIHFEWMFSGREPSKKLGVEIHFEDNIKTENIRILKHFEEQRITLEEAS